MPKILTIIVIIIVAIAILTGLARQIASALEAGKRLDQAADTVSALQDKNRELKVKLTEVKSPQYIEQIARNKLNMAKPDDTVIVIPKELINKVLGVNTKVEQIKLPNWQGWLKLVGI